MLTVCLAFHHPCQGVDVVSNFASVASPEYIPRRIGRAHQRHHIRLLGFTSPSEYRGQRRINQLLPVSCQPLRRRFVP